MYDSRRLSQSRQRPSLDFALETNELAKLVWLKFSARHAWMSVIDANSTEQQSVTGSGEPRAIGETFRHAPVCRR